MDDILDTYDKAKKWLNSHVHKNYFPSNTYEFNLLSDLLNRHPSKSEWKNQTPTSFKISRSPGNGAVVMYVRFEGLSNYRIVSWVACAKGKLAKHQQSDNDDNKLNGAMRYAVRIQISNYKKAHHSQVCFLCNTEYRIEVDHYPKHFVEIKEGFLKIKGEKGELPPTEFKWHPKKGNFMFKDGTKANDYYDKKWKLAWQKYHNKHAEYRYLCSTCNKKTNKSTVDEPQITKHQITKHQIKHQITKHQITEPSLAPVIVELPLVHLVTEPVVVELPLVVKLPIIKIVPQGKK